MVSKRDVITVLQCSKNPVRQILLMVYKLWASVEYICFKLFKNSLCLHNQHYFICFPQRNGWYIWEGKPWSAGILSSLWISVSQQFLIKMLNLCHLSGLAVSTGQYITALLPRELVRARHFTAVHYGWQTTFKNECIGFSLTLYMKEFKLNFQWSGLMQVWIIWANILVKLYNIYI